MIKIFIIILWILIFNSIVLHTEYRLNLHIGSGYSISPYFPTLYKYHNNTINIKGINIFLQGGIKESEKLNLGIELGYMPIYDYKYYWVNGYSNEYSYFSIPVLFVGEYKMFNSENRINLNINYGAGLTNSIWKNRLDNISFWEYRLGVALKFGSGIYFKIYDKISIEIPINIYYLLTLYSEKALRINWGINISYIF